ncbi:MAG: C40 family peptidase [Thermodesulfobacteriota bacterium]
MRKEVVQQGFILLGKPYKLGARGPEAFDCSGLVYYIFQRIGLTLPFMTEGLLRQGYSISGDRVQEGDLVFFKNIKEFHVGIMINKQEFIHASTRRGVVIDTIKASYWKRSLIGFKSVL